MTFPRPRSSGIAPRVPVLCDPRVRGGPARGTMPVAMETTLIKLGVQLLVFTAVIAIAAWRLEGVSVRPKRWLPVLTLALVGLNASLYWALSPLIAFAIPVVGFLVAPFALNLLLLWGANRLVRRIEVKGLLRLSLVLAVANLSMSLGFSIAL